MNTIRRLNLLVILLGLATILSLTRDLSSTRRVISSSQEFYFEKDGSAIDDGPYVKDSKRHYMWDEMLETRYSTTHQKMRGQFSMILNDNDETNDGNNDFQHKAILRTSSEKHGKWISIRYKIRPDAEFTVAGETIHKAGTNYSKFVDDMRLVIDANQSIIFNSIEMKNITANDKNDDDNRLCHILRLLTFRKSLDVVPKSGIPPIVLNVTADCNILNKKVNGQGNTVLALYGLRMITALAKVDFKFQCKNNDFEGGNSIDDNSNDYKKEKSRKLRWVFPWFASFQSASNDRDPWPYRGDEPTEDQVCSSQSSDLDHGNGIMPLEKMADQIRDDVRKMALQLMGSQTEDPKRIHPLIPLDVEPWIPNIAPDDVIIHFPCYSDVNDWDDTTTRRKSRVGILQFSEYTKHINENVKSIGIIREAWGEPSQNSNENVCNRASTLLLEYLQSFYTNHPVSISIYENDILPLQYARIAMAKQSFSSFSSFGMIPIIGTFGEGYFQPSDSSKSATPSGNTANQNSIFRNIILGKYKGFENINLMNGNALSPNMIDAMSFSDVSDWLLKYSSREILNVTKDTESSDGIPRLEFNEVSRRIDEPKEIFSKNISWNEETYKSLQTQGATFDRENKIIIVGDEKGYINENGQLVIDVNETYLFWNDGQKELCNLLQNMTLVASLDENSRHDVPSTVLNVTMDCVDHNDNKQGLGQGNWVTAIYAARMAAFLAGVDFSFQCLDGQTSKMSLLLPWFDKYQVATPMTRTAWPHGGDRPTAKDACPPKYPYLRIDKMAYEIQDDLRKMAVSLVGTRDEIRQHPDIPDDATPLIPNVQLDDVALHFRCGDVLGGARRNDFGMIRFNEYKKWIPNNTESIGILTQPFEEERNRGQDSKKVDNCRTVVYALVDYLQEFLPNARISIRNGVNETLPLAYARLVMANHSITSLSSFGIFPVIGTFGQGYFQKGNRGVNPFATHVPNILSNVHQMEADVRGTGQMMGKSIENLVEWFLNDTDIA